MTLGSAESVAVGFVTTLRHAGLDVHPGLVRSALARPSGSNRELKIGVTHANPD